MITAHAFAAALKARGVRLVAGVPCSFFRPAIDVVAADPELTYVAAANEGAALAIAAGAFLGGATPAVFLQNSGLGNLVNPLTSLSALYGIPTYLFVSGRGSPPATADEPQHAIMGGKTVDLLRLLGTKTAELPDSPAALATALARAERRMAECPAPVAFVVRKGTIADERCAAPVDARPLARRDAVRAVAVAVGADDALVATTGHISRELFDVADRPGNFYMQGSMGHAAGIGLGLALARPARRVVVLDGDGAALMHLGTFSTIGHYAPPNLLHVVLDNEAYESTGNQDATSRTTALEAVATACGYRRSVRCATETDLEIALRSALTGAGPTLILAKVSRRSSAALPRISERYAPHDITAGFLRAG